MSLYLIRAGNFVKIGVSKNIKSRLKTLQTSNPVELKLLAYTIGNDEYDYIIESEIHEEFEDHRAKGEWFTLTKDQLINIVKKYNFESDYDLENSTIWITENDIIQANYLNKLDEVKEKFQEYESQIENFYERKFKERCRKESYKIKEEVCKAFTNNIFNMLHEVGLGSMSIDMLTNQYIQKKLIHE